MCTANCVYKYCGKAEDYLKIDYEYPSFGVATDVDRNWLAVDSIEYKGPKVHEVHKMALLSRVMRKPIL